ncbi:MAG TPA: selenocysteine-specific translation elongation factor [Ardenticatenaceae bacterium]|nr:selenocysteine-specific translation elongation factor [Ardenticatenaceae bacterium]
MRVIGTAGHVDHGKSTLVQALSGINPDRLKEEQEREMTIDLGFAWITLPSGREASIVDVPGHEDFIKNMLAGVAGFDLALLVIAADESVMPQTREHLAILNLLAIPRNVVALTKIDLVDDPEWLDLVCAEIEETLAPTHLAGAPILPVSARTGVGLDRLSAALDQLLDETNPRPDLGRPRLPVDRTFVMSGFGTVVTGTLADGSFAVGDEIEVLPSGKRARIRGLQSHNLKVERAGPGRRVAINVSGIDTVEIRRGDVVARPGTYAATSLVDVALDLLPDAPAPLRHNQSLDFFSGAAEALGHVRLIGSRELVPGERTFAQLRLDRPVVLARGDRFIVRQPSPSQTLGGGVVLDADPGRRWRRFRPETVQRFRLLSEGSPADLVLQRLQANEPTDEGTLTRSVPLPAGTVSQALTQLLAEGQALRLADGSLLSARGWTRLGQEMDRILAAYHQQFPLRLGMPREELASRLQLKPKPFAAFLAVAVAQGLIVETGGVVSRLGHAVRLSPSQQAGVAAVLAQFAAQPYTPPNAGDAIRALGEELLTLLVARGDLVRLSPEVLLAPRAYAEMRQFVAEHIHAHGSITAAELRDRFDTSRKFAIALLEHLDNQHVTRRVGDKRILR